MIKKFFASKTIAYYVGLVTALCSMAESIIYASTYTGSDYYSVWVIVFPILGCLAFLGLSSFKITSRYAAALLCVFDFVGFLLFINAVYIYLSSAFYGGVNMESIQALEPRFVVVILFYLLTVIVSNVVVYLRLNRKEETK